jgi:16S rRNA (cytidine1402-2'-O)-methyltransferase
MPSNEIEKGVLYVVPTPIGNLSDITPRAKETLENCDFIAAEDTRVSGKLLMLLGIKKPMVSYHEHNKMSEGKKVCERIKSGETCALVTDAGTPAISDPGSELVALCAENGIKVISLPGACAAVTALAGSGIPSRRFCFEGFLPESTAERREYLESIKLEKRTLIYYIAPHDLDKAIAELSRALGNRRCVLAKELTKINEKYFYTTLSELPAVLDAAGSAVKRENLY